MEYVKLGDVCTVEKTLPEIKSEKTWLLNLDMIESGTGKILSYNYVSEAELNGSIVPFSEDTVLYSKLRPNLNKVVLPSFGGYATSEILPLKPNPLILNREYLAVFLRSESFVNWAISKTAGAKMPRLGTKVLLDKEIPLYSLDKQEKIASIIKKIDMLLELRQQQLEKLDTLVKSQFIEMFGDIPKEQYQTIKDVCHIVTDGTHQPPKFVSEGIPFLLVSNIANNEVTYETSKFITEETYNELIKRTPIEIGDILLSTVGSYGHPAIVKCDKKFCFQRHIAYLKPNTEIIDSVFLYATILSHEVQSKIDNLVLGVAQKTLNLSAIRSIEIPVPPMEQQKRFCEVFEQADKSRFAIQSSISKLETLKKSLMQEYFG